MNRIGFSNKITIAIAVIFLLKTIATVFIVPVSTSSDFGNWVYLASDMYSQLVSGVVPSIEWAGVYAGMGLFLAPFYGAWRILPISHPTIAQALNSQLLAERVPLVFFMKLPIILFDLFAGLVIASIARNISPRNVSAKAFFVWYLNPYAFYLMEYMGMGTFDIVPTAIVLVSVLFAMRRKWTAAGFSLAVAALLRLYPIIAFPAFLFYVYRRHLTRATIQLCVSFAFVMLTAVLVQGLALGSLNAVLNSIINMLYKAPWLGLFYVFPINDYLTYTPIIVAAQIYLIAALWKTHNNSIAYSVLASLLALLLASYHQPYHFIWVVPLLSLYFAINEDSTFLFSTIFVGAFLASLGYDTTNSTLIILQPLFAATFYGAKAAYLMRINWQAINFQVSVPATIFSRRLFPKIVEPSRAQ